MKTSNVASSLRCGCSTHRGALLLHHYCWSVRLAIGDCWAGCGFNVSTMCLLLHLRLLQSAHISYHEAAREFVVHVGLHEIGHLQEVEYGIAAPNKWFNEMLASYFSYAYLKARQPPVATVVEALDQIPLKPMPHTSLEDFEKLYLDVGMENYVWYQQQFERRAIKVYAEQGLEFLKKVKSAFPAAGNSPLETKKDELTPTALILRLERICPGFQAWASELQSMSSPSKP
jgi:hypothetical protein